MGEGHEGNGRRLGSPPGELCADERGADEPGASRICQKQGDAGHPGRASPHLPKPGR
jgi:hypothetical protein